MRKKKARGLKTLILILFFFAFINVGVVNATSYVKENDIVLRETKKINVTFNANGGTVSKKSKNVTVGSKFGTLPTPTKKGYKFTGWYTKSSGGVKKTSTSKVTGTKNITLYAHYSKVKYKITYKLNSGTNNSSNPTYYYVTSSKKLYNPTRKGYTFNGWYSDSSYKTKVTKIVKGSTENKTLYAKWTANTYSITYNGNGSTSGSTSKQTNLKYGKSYTLRSNGYKKTNYTFQYWNTKKDGSGKTYKASTSAKNLTTVNGKNVTLYAIWKNKNDKTPEEKEEPEEKRSKK